MRLNSITMFEDDGEWIVLIVENGVESRRLFKHEEYARSWCDGQRVRLGLPMLFEA